MSITETAATSRSMYPRELVSSRQLQAVKRRFVLGLNIVSGAGFIAAVIMVVRDGLMPLDAALFAMMYTLTAIGITVGYHRYFAHAAFETGAAVRTLLAIA